MTDAELTALAAKAFCDAPVGFSPLTDDGDALRLAVRLGISVTIRPDSSGARVEHAVGWHSSMVMRSSDPCADTRRAIVRVAAALGREPTPKDEQP